MPFEPDVLGKHSSFSSPRIPRTSRATSQHSTIVAGGPGSKSSTRISAFAISSTRDIDVCSSRSARFASQASVARLSQTQKSMYFLLLRDQISSVRTKSGCGGHCFW